jgi:hypothetical protein
MVGVALRYYGGGDLLTGDRASYSPTSQEAAESVDARSSEPNLPNLINTVKRRVDAGQETKNGQTATYEPIRPKPKQTEAEHWCSIQ